MLWSVAIRIFKIAILDKYFTLSFSSMKMLYKVLSVFSQFAAVDSTSVFIKEQKQAFTRVYEGTQKTHFNYSNSLPMLRLNIQ